MKNKKLLLIILAFVLLIGGASVLYAKLSAQAAPEQLAVQEPQPQEEKPVEEPTAQEEPNAPEDTEAQEEATPSEENKAPDFTVYDIDGNAVHLSDYVGKPVILNFWASWCGPCKMEMPDFQEKFLELGEEVQFLLVNLTDGSGETVDSASGFIAEQGYTFPVFYDTDVDAAAAYGVSSIPATYFIDAEGNAIARANGAIDAETLQKGIDMIYP